MQKALQANNGVEGKDLRWTAKVVIQDDEYLSILRSTVVETHWRLTATISKLFFPLNRSKTEFLSL